MHEDMQELYEEFESERDKLHRLVLDAKEKHRPIATDDAIIVQSRKVDWILGRLMTRDGSASKPPPIHDPNYPH
jgi:hypothetical protein